MANLPGGLLPLGWMRTLRPERQPRVMCIDCVWTVHHKAALLATRKHRPLRPTEVLEPTYRALQALGPITAAQLGEALGIKGETARARVRRLITRQYARQVPGTYPAQYEAVQT
ncbi:MAG: AsnC family protein [Chloroflexi bacterium]|nr:AsnC family protein [Chloroflexota bacterium]MCY4112193.1 AsnC family protein [Chloroflexota bacterium]